MENLVQLLGQALPDTTTVLGGKILCVGLGGIGAGLALMGSGIDGMAPRGGAIAACGFAASGLAVRVLIRESRREEATRIEERLRQEEERLRQESEAHRVRGQTLRQGACDGHDWYFDDYGLNYDVWCWICRKCGAVTDENPGREPG